MPAHGFDEWFTATETEVAGLLEDLAAEVGDGTVSLGRTEVDVPDEVDVELEYERDGDEHELELELSWAADRDDCGADAEDGESDAEDGESNAEDGESDAEDGESDAADEDPEEGGLDFSKPTRAPD